MKVVSFFSTVPGLIHINGALAGHSLEEPLSVCIPEGSFVLSYMPMPAGYLPINNIIDLNGSMSVYDGTISVYLLWDNIINIKLAPVKMEMEPQMPYTMSSSDISFNGRMFHAVVYFDRKYSFYIEEQGKGIVFATCFEGQLLDCRISWKIVRGALVLLAEGRKERHREVICVTIGKDITLEFKEECNNVRFAEEEIYTLCPVHSRCAIQARRSRKMIDGHMSDPREEVMIPQGGSQLTPYDLIYGVQMGSEVVMTGCLSKQLSDQLSPEDMADFFGDFIQIEEELSNGDTLALSYQISEGVYGVKRYQFESTNGTIFNIDQLD